MNSEQKAATAWLRTGRPANALRSMTEEEIDELAELTDEHGQAVPAFNDRFREFYEGYLENRKASEG